MEIAPTSIRIPAGSVEFIDLNSQDNGAIIRFHKMNDEISAPSQALYVPSNCTIMIITDDKSGNDYILIEH